MSNPKPIYTLAHSAVCWLVPASEHTDEHPFCSELECACHYDGDRVERLVTLIEQRVLDIPTFLSIYHGAAIPPRMEVEV